MNRLLYLYSHGISRWLLQRLTAVVMTIYTLLFAAVLLVVRPAGYSGWKHLFDVQAVKICTFAFILSLLLHAWLGVQGVLADYIQAQVARRTLKWSVAGLLAGLGLWSVFILWRTAA